MSLNPMHKKKLSTWSLLLGSAVLGTIVSITATGCRPSAITDVDTSTDTSNTTAAAVGVADVSPSAALETPVEADPSGDDSAESTGTNESATKDDTTAQQSAEAESAPAVKATQLVALADEAVKPEDVLKAGGDWPQWGGTRLRNNAPSVTGLTTQWNIGKFDRRSGEWNKEQSGKHQLVFARLGSQTYGNPVVADGRVFVGTNNGAGHLETISVRTLTWAVCWRLMKRQANSFGNTAAKS